MQKMGEAMLGLALVIVALTAMIYRVVDSTLIMAMVVTALWVAGLRYKNISKPLALYAIFPLAAAVMYFLYSAVNSSVAFRYSALSIATLALVMFFIYKKGANTQRA